MGRGETESEDGRTPYPSAPDEMRKAGFFILSSHMLVVSPVPKRDRDNPLRAGFFLLAICQLCGNLCESTTR